MSTFLEQIINRALRGPVPVPTPEWPALDGKLFIRPLKPVERLAFYDLARAQKPAAGAEYLTLMAVYCACDGAGNRVFDDGDWKEISADTGSGPAIERLAEAADELHSLTDFAREQIKKKYVATPASDSSSASPGPSASA
jgi:hypothetical protein